MSRLNYPAEQMATQLQKSSGKSPVIIEASSHCFANFLLHLLYFRYKDNVKVQATANRMVLDDSLVFLHVISKKGDAGDTGTYYCLARSEAGKAKSRNATLEVACKCTVNSDN